VQAIHGACFGAGAGAAMLAAVVFMFSAPRCMTGTA
jgi:hypothetical protein